MSSDSRIKWVILLICLIGTGVTGCDITFKRKSDAEPDKSTKPAAPLAATDQQTSATGQKTTAEKPVATEQKKDSTKRPKIVSGFSEQDRKTIGLFYTSPANAKVLDDIIEHTQVSAVVQNKLSTDSVIPNSVQLFPLPLELEKQLIPLPLHLMRVQIEKKILLIDIKTRFILDSVEL